MTQIQQISTDFMPPLGVPIAIGRGQKTGGRGSLLCSTSRNRKLPTAKPEHLSPSGVEGLIYLSVKISGEKASDHIVADVIMQRRK